MFTHVKSTSFYLHPTGNGELETSCHFTPIDIDAKMYTLGPRNNISESQTFKPIQANFFFFKLACMGQCNLQVLFAQNVVAKGQFGDRKVSPPRDLTPLLQGPTGPSVTLVGPPLLRGILSIQQQWEAL